MVSSSAILSSVVAFAAWAVSVHGHGYMYIPLAEFVDKTTSEWIVQIEPQWDGDWAGDDEHRVEIYKTLAAERNITNTRSFLDTDTTLYGADCGYTDPDADAKDIPNTETATLSRGIVHAGPCEIWLDDTLVMYNDDCQAAYSPEEDQDVKTVFPMDYSSCSSSGCMLRFYWLALQSLDGEVVWQVYKNCVPLKGGSGTTTSTTTSTASSTAASTESSAEAEASSSAAAEASTDGEEATEAPATETEAPSTETEAPETEAPETEAPAATTAAPSSDSKCNARKRV